jgi:hypothetical protein
MSTQDSPQVFGPHQLCEEQTPGGANPLRRTSDRVEAGPSRFQLVMLVLGLPAASVSAGLAAYGSAMRTVEAQSAQRHRVTARLTSAPESAPRSAADEKQKVQVSWTGEGGRQQTRTARVPLDKAVGSTARIWVDHSDRCAYRLRRCTQGDESALDRRTYAQRDGEREPAEPLWSARFHRRQARRQR